MKHPYFDKEVVLTSKHEKLNLVKPAFDQHVGCKVFEVNLDTDQLGTFSGEIERKAPPQETAILKARLGMKSTGSSIGIASEGTVGPDPLVPFMHSNTEHLVLVDDENEIVISETYRSFDITVASIAIGPDDDIAEFLEKADFPNHKLIVRSNGKGKERTIKGISSLAELEDAIELMANSSPNRLVVIESDLRAMSSPSRQKNIEQVAKLLALRLSRLCPKCQSPGWGVTGYEKGVDCSKCGLNNSEAKRQQKLGCVKCDYSEPGVVIETNLDPALCNFCNP